LVIGTDGLHSNVRNLVFGDEIKFEKYFGYYVAAFTIKNYFPINNPINKDNSYFSYNTPGKQIDIYPINENELTALFIFSSDQKLDYAHHDVNRQKQILRNEFRDVEWESSSLLERLDDAADFYFDSVSQIRMEQWSEGRVSLLGDAAFAPSLLAGQGSSLAMVAAYILAGELKEANGNYKEAFKRYQAIFKPFIEYKQNVARSFAHSLVPKNSFSIWTRRTFSNWMSLSFLAEWFIKKYMTDNIKLKEYSSTGYDELISASQERNNSPILH
jgi:2-polyprenyl-6-methoxyphenol hydroxylase-like FAD-dependent oxidoreductase